MKIKLTIIISIVCLFSMTNRAQQRKIQPLKIGDKIPDFVFADLKNTVNKTQKASDLYRRGLLIINFWASWCVPCVREMPYLDSLENEKSDVFNMVCFTNQNNDEVTRYLLRNPKVKHLLFSAADKKLIKYFPHKILPHNVWIDKNGIVRALTGDDEINDKNIQAFLGGNEKLSKKAEDLTFDWHEKLKAADTEFIYRSVITPFKNIGNGGVFNLDATNNTTRFLAWNRTITDLLWNALMKRSMDDYDWNLVEVHTKDSSRYFYPAFIHQENWQRKYSKEIKQWSKKNEYCYELFFKGKIHQNEFYAQMVSDLSKVFHVKAYLKIDEKQSIIISVLTGKTVVKDTSRQLVEMHFEKATLIANGQTIDQLILDLNKFYPEMPRFVNHTNIKYPIAMKYDFGDISDWRF